MFSMCKVIFCLKISEITKFIIRSCSYHAVRKFWLLSGIVKWESPRKDARGGMSKDMLNLFLGLFHSCKECVTTVFKGLICCGKTDLVHSRPCKWYGRTDCSSNKSQGICMAGAYHCTNWVNLAKR